ncbi:MAG: NUDIX domain-containing protein [Clostridia bacterium]
MSKKRYETRVAVFLLLVKNDLNNNKKILLQKRENTGYMDGMYDTCASGHLEFNESIKEAMIREAKEETCIEINSKDLNLVLTYHASQRDNEVPYLRFYFTTNNYVGEPKIGEKEKCSEMIWADLDKLPQNIIPHLKIAIDNYIKGNNYCQDEF